MPLPKKIHRIAASTTASTNASAVSAWSNLTRLACPSCFVHGRHRGHSISDIRDAAETLAAFVCENVEREVFSARSIRNELRSLQHCELGMQTDLINLKEKIKAITKQFRASIDEAEKKALLMAEAQAGESLRQCKRAISVVRRRDAQTTQSLELCQNYINKTICEEEFLRGSSMIRGLEGELQTPTEGHSVKTFTDVEVVWPEVAARKDAGELDGLCRALQNVIKLTQEKTWLFNS